MSVDVTIYLPQFSRDVLLGTLQRLADQGISIELAPELLSGDVHEWEGFIPMRVDISRLRKHQLPQFETGFEVDIEAFRYSPDDELLDEDTDAEIQRKVKASKNVLTIYAAGQPASMALQAAFGAALAEASGGAYFDCQDGEFIDECQSLSGLMASDLVEQFSSLGEADLK